MNHDWDDALERALFAMPLEEPPADLRASIMAATVYRPPAAFKLWETWALGACAGIFVWLVIEMVLGDATRFVHALTAMGAFVLSAASQPSTLLWIALGAGIATWLSVVDLGAITVPRRILHR